MPVIGHFRREGDGFAGRLSTLGLDVTLRLLPTPKVGAKGPDFRALVGEVEVGAAWKAGEIGGAILNLKLDDPTWPEPIHARLMPSEDGALPLSWIRRVEDKPAAPPGPD